MNIANWKIRKLLTILTLAGFILAQGLIPQPALADPAAQPTSYEEVGAHLDYWANRYNIPPVVLKAVAWMESGWRQYKSNGDPLIGADGVGIGIMQISHYNPNDQAEIDRLKYDIDYNIERGAQALNQKWRAYPKIGNGDRNVLENWYFAIWGYNGWASVNNPNNPAGKGSGAYQDVVFELMGQKYNSAVTFAPGATKIARESLPATGLPNLEGQWATPQVSHQGDLAIDVNNLVTAGGWYGDAAGDYWYNYSPWSSYYALGFYVTAYNGAGEADKPAIEGKLLNSYRNLLTTADDLLVNNNGSEVLVRRAGKYYWTVWQGPRLDQGLSEQAWQGIGKANLKSAQMNLGAQYDEVLGTAGQELPLVHNSEMALGNWLTDVMKAKVPTAELALLNPETMTGGLSQGEITRGDIYELVPYDYKLVTIDMTGADILALLEAGVSKGSLLQASGLKYTWDPAQPENKKLQSVTLLDGTAIDPARSYKVVTTDVLAEGKDGYSTFRQGQNRQDTYILLRDALLEDLTTRTTLSGTPDGRAKAVAAKPAPAPAPAPKKYVEVTASVLNLRTGPGAQHGVAAVLPRGTKLELVSTANGWAKVLYNGKTYYVSAQYVKDVPQVVTPGTPPPATAPTSPPAASPTGTSTNNAEITAGYLNLRTGPGTGYQVAGTLTKGTKVELVSTANGWAKIKYQGKVYYVAAEYVKKLSPSSGSGGTVTPAPAQPNQPAVKYVEVTASYLNLRIGPGTGYQVAGNLVKGTKVELVSSANGWAKIKYQGKTYYVAAEYVGAVLR